MFVSCPACVGVCVCVLCLGQAPTVEVKVLWLTEIRKILANKLKLQQGDKNDSPPCKTKVVLRSSASIFLI